MHLYLSCQNCSQNLRVERADAGKHVRCPPCQSISAIPSLKELREKIRESQPSLEDRLEELRTGDRDLHGDELGDIPDSLDEEEELPGILGYHLKIDHIETIAIFVKFGN